MLPTQILECLSNKLIQVDLQADQIYDMLYSEIVCFISVEFAKPITTSQVQDTIQYGSIHQPCLAIGVNRLCLDWPSNLFFKFNFCYI